MVSSSRKSNIIHDNWNIGKREKFLVNILIGSIVCWLVPHKFAHFTETLLLLGQPWSLGYSLFYGLVFAASLEVFGCYEEIGPLRIRHFFLSLCSGLLAGIILILSVWLLKYEFVGRYVFLNISIFFGIGVLSLGFGNYQVGFLQYTSCLSSHIGRNGSEGKSEGKRGSN